MNILLDNGIELWYKGVIMKQNNQKEPAYAEVMTQVDKQVVTAFVAGIETPAEIATRLGVFKEAVIAALKKGVVTEAINNLQQIDLIRLLKAHYVQAAIVELASHLKTVFTDEENSVRERMQAMKEYRRILDDFIRDQKMEAQFVEIEPKKFEMMEKAYLGTLKAQAAVAKNGPAAVATYTTFGNRPGAANGQGSGGGVSEEV